MLNTNTNTNQANISTLNAVIIDTFYKVEMYEELDKFITEAENTDLDIYTIGVIINNTKVMLNEGVEYTILDCLKSERDRLRLEIESTIELKQTTTGGGLNGSI